RLFLSARGAARSRDARACRGGRAMKPASVVATVAVGLLLQMVLARFAAGGAWVFDLVLVAVVFAGLQWGPAAGIVAGAIGGLGQDLISGGIVGISGLAKTPIGLMAGLIGTQFVLTRP